MRLVTPEIDAFLDWFTHASEIDWMSGTVRVTEWPRPGGLMKQSARLVHAVDLVKAELRYLPREEKKKEPEKQPEKKGAGA